MHRHDEEDDTELIRARVKNRLLASRLKKTEKSSDESVAALLVELESAKAALYTIWESADLNCEPQDHEEIVEYATTAIAEYRANSLWEQSEY